MNRTTIQVFIELCGNLPIYRTLAAFKCSLNRKLQIRLTASHSVYYSEIIQLFANYTYIFQALCRLLIETSHLLKRPNEAEEPVLLAALWSCSSFGTQPAASWADKTFLLGLFSFKK